MNISEKLPGVDIEQAKQQLQALCERHVSGELSDESYETARVQIERRILDQLLSNQATPPASWHPMGRRRWGLLGGLVLLLAVGVGAWSAYRAHSSANGSSVGQKTYRLSSSGSVMGGADPHAAILGQINATTQSLAPQGLASSDSVVAMPTVSGTVVLAPALLKEAKPDDTIFIFARPAQGSRMPLAMLRKQVRDLPVQFVLDDSTAMSPQTRLSQAGQVIVVARVTKAANAAPLRGDLMGRAGPVPVGSKGLTIQISEIVNE